MANVINRTTKQYLTSVHIATKQRELAIEALKIDGILNINGDLIK